MSAVAIHQLFGLRMLCCAVLDRLIFAEEAILLRGGCVLRLAGLYNATRGPHSYWLRLAREGKAVDTNADGLVNLIHYEDAASLVLRILQVTGTPATVCSIEGLTQCVGLLSAACMYSG